MSILFAVVLVACEACDELAKPGVAHPFAIGTSWRPKCDPAKARFVEADPWPKAGEVRRDAFTRDCTDVSLTRVFVSANGYTADELFVGSLIERKVGRGSSAIRAHEFVGQAGDYSYRYHFTADGQRVLASVEGPRVTSHLISTVLKPGSRARFGSVQTIACEVWRGQCELLMKRAIDDVPSSLVSVVFDAAHLDGNVCVDVPPSAGTAISVNLEREPGRVIDVAQSQPGSARACLGERSAAALAATGEGAVTYRVNRDGGDEVTPWDVVELDARGLNEAVGLARFLLKRAVLSVERAGQARKFKAEADSLLAGSQIPN